MASSTFSPVCLVHPAVGLNTAARSCRRVAAQSRLLRQTAGSQYVRGTLPAGRRTDMLRRSPDSLHVKAAGSDDEPAFKKNTEFGYSRKDVILIGMGVFALGYAMYYGLQAFGVEPGMAGNWVQLVVVLALMVGWLASYLLRVANKDMTYVKQLEDYETAVMAKRMEEMPEAELQKMLEELEAEKNKK